MDSFKRNYIVYFSYYFVNQMMWFFIHVYLPIYYFNILNVDRKELAFIQFFSYLALFTRPLLSIYFDKKETTSKRKLIIELSSFVIIISFFISLFNLHILIIFGIFLGIYFIFISIIDVCIDKTIVESSPTEKIQIKNTTVVRLGTLIGAVFTVIAFFIIFSDYSKANQWTLYFLICFVAIIPLLFLAPLLSLNANMTDATDRMDENHNHDKIYLKPIILMCFFMFLFYAVRLYEYPLEPWALNKYFNGNYIYFSMFYLLMIIMLGFGVLIAGIMSHKYDRKKALILSTFLIGIFTIIVPYSTFIIFVILSGLIQLLIGFWLVDVMVVIIKLSKKKVLYFQIIMSFVFIATVVFIPLGTYLSAYIETELIIMLSGIITLFSLIPLIFIENKLIKAD